MNNMQIICKNDPLQKAIDDYNKINGKTIKYRYDRGLYENYYNARNNIFWLEQDNLNYQFTLLVNNALACFANQQSEDHLKIADDLKESKKVWCKIKTSQKNRDHYQVLNECFEFIDKIKFYQSKIKYINNDSLYKTFQALFENWEYNLSNRLEGTVESNLIFKDLNNTISEIKKNCCKADLLWIEQIEIQLGYAQYKQNVFIDELNLYQSGDTCIKNLTRRCEKVFTLNIEKYTYSFSPLNLKPKKNTFVPDIANYIEEELKIPIPNYSTTDEWKLGIKYVRESNNPFAWVHLIQAEISFYQELYTESLNNVNVSFETLSKLLEVILSRLQPNIELEQALKNCNKNPFMLVLILEKSITIQKQIMSFIDQQVINIPTELKQKHPQKILNAALQLSFDTYLSYRSCSEILSNVKRSIAINKKVFSSVFNQTVKKENEINKPIVSLSWTKVGTYNESIQDLRESTIFNCVQATLRGLAEHLENNGDIDDLFFNPISTLTLNTVLGVPSSNTFVLNQTKNINIIFLDWILSLGNARKDLMEKTPIKEIKPVELIKKEMLDAYWMLVHYLFPHFDKDTQNKKLTQEGIKEELLTYNFIRQIISSHHLSLTLTEKQQGLITKLTKLYIDQVEKTNRKIEELSGNSGFSLSSSNWKYQRWGQLLIPNASVLDIISNVFNNCLNTFLNFKGFDFIAKADSLIENLSSLKNSTKITPEIQKEIELNELALLKFFIDQIIERIRVINRDSIEWREEKSPMGKLYCFDLKNLEEAYKILLLRYSKIAPPAYDDWITTIYKTIIGTFGEITNIPIMGQAVLFNYKKVDEIVYAYNLAKLGYDPLKNIMEVIPSYNKDYLFILKDLRKIISEFYDFAVKHPREAQKFAQALMIIIYTIEGKSAYETFKATLFAQMIANSFTNCLGNTKPFRKLERQELKFQALVDMTSGYLVHLTGVTKGLLNLFSFGVLNSLPQLLGVSAESFKQISTTEAIICLSQLTSSNAENIWTLLECIDGDFNHVVNVHSRKALLEAAVNFTYACLHPEKFLDQVRMFATIWVNTLLHPQEETERFFRFVVQLGGPIVIASSVLIFICQAGIWFSIPLSIAFASYTSHLVLQAYHFINSQTTTLQEVENNLLGNEQSIIRLKCQEKIREITDRYFTDLRKYNAVLDLPKYEALKDTLEKPVSSFVNLQSKKKIEELNKLIEKEKLESAKEFVRLFKKSITPDILKNEFTHEFVQYMRETEFTDLEEETQEQIIHQVAVRIVVELQNDWLRRKVEDLFEEEMLFDIKHNGKNESLAKALEEIEMDPEKGQLLKDIHAHTETYLEEKLSKQNNYTEEGRNNVKYLLQGFKNARQMIRSSDF